MIAQLVNNLPAMQKTPAGFLGREDLLEKPVDRRAWWAIVHRVTNRHD